MAVIAYYSAFQLTPLTLSELRAVVYGVNGSAACGEDGVTIPLIRLSFEAIGTVLLHLVNSSISLQLSANFHCSCDCQNCRAGRSPATLQLPVHESPPFTNTAWFSVASFYRNRTDRHIGPHPFRQRPGRDIPPLPAVFSKCFQMCPGMVII